MKRHGPYLILLAIVAVGASLRLLYLQDISRTPFFDTPLIDASFNDYWARGLATGEWVLPEEYPDPQLQSWPYYKFPGYPWFLAGVYRAFGHGFLAPRLVQFLLGLAGSIAVFFLARKRLGSAAAVIASAFMSFCWLFIHFEGELYDSSLAIVLTVLLLYCLSLCLDRVTFLRAGLAGIALGLLALVRGNVLLFAPFAAGWLVWLARRKQRPPPLLALAGLVLGVILPLAPVAIRNRLVSGDRVMLSCYGGFNLYIGNNEETTGTQANIPNFEEMTGLGTWTPYHYPVIVRKLGDELGHEVSPSEASRYWTGKAIEYVKTHPGPWLAMTLRKFALLWGPHEIGDPVEIHYARQDSRVLRVLPYDFSFVLSLAVVGVVFMLLRPSLRKSFPHAIPAEDMNAVTEFGVLLAMFVFAYALSVLPFLVLSRYRAPVLPPLAMLAAWGAVCLARQLFDRRAPRRAVIAVAAWLALYAVLRYPYVPYEPSLKKWRDDWAYAYMQRGQADEAIRSYREVLRLAPDSTEAHNNLGALLREKGRIAEARGHFESVIRLDPSDAKAHNNLGVLLAGIGQHEKAEVFYRKAIDLKPDYADAHDNYGLLLVQMKRPEEAVVAFGNALALTPENGQVHGHLGYALAMLGQGEEALQHLARAVHLSPGSAEPKKNLGMLLIRLDRREQAADCLADVVRIDPADVDSFNSLGGLLVQLGRVEEGASHLREAIRLDPRHARAYNNLGAAYVHLGEIGKALEQFERAVQINPDYRDARANLEKVRRRLGN